MPSSLIRKGIWASVAVAAAVVLVVAALPFIASTRIVRDRVAIELSAWSGYRVELGSAPELEVWPFRAILSNVTLSSWNDPTHKPVVVAERMEIELSALAALRGDIVFATARLIRPTLHVSPTAGKIPLPASPGGGRIARSIEIARAVVSTNPAHPDLGALPSDPFGKIEFFDGRITVERGGVDEELVTSLAGNVSWAALDRGGVLSATGIWRGESVTLDVTAPEPLILFAGGASPLTVKLKSAPGNLSFDGTANLSGDTYFAGPLSLSSPSLRRMLEWSTEGPAGGPAIGPVAVSGQVAGNSQRMRLEDAHITLDNNPGMGVLDVTFTTAVPTISGTLAFESLDLRSVLSAFTRLNPESGTASRTDTLLDDRFNLDLRLSSANATAGSITLADVAATAQIKPGLAAFDISDARVFGGSIQTGIRFDRQPSGNLVELRLLATDIDGGLLAAASDAAFVAPTGRGTVSVILKGQGTGWDELFEKGDGSITASFGQGTIPHFDLNAFLDRLKQGGFFPLSEATRGALPVSSVELKATISKGAARIDKAEATAPSHTISLSGIVPYVGRGLALSGSVRAKDANAAPAVATFFVGGSWTAPFVVPAQPSAPAAD